jgi:multicomponent Na+:H+ antiporter subunit E
MQKLYRYIRRLLLLSGLWWLLVGSDNLSWYFGGTVILLVSLWRLNDLGAKESAFRFWRLAWFVPYFLWRTVIGSCDVAWRALHWKRPITPAMTLYELRLPANGAARVVFANCLSLSPGTLAVAWHQDTLLVHVIAEGIESTAAVKRLESQVAWMFGYRLESKAKANRVEEH